MDRLAHFVHRYAKVILILVVILNLASLVSLWRVRIETDFMRFFSEDNQVYTEYERLREKYDMAEPIVILVEDDESLLTEENLAALHRLQTPVEQLEGVSQVQSFLPSEVPIGGHEWDVDEKFIRLHADELEDFIENRSPVTDQLLSADRGTGLLTVTLEHDAPEAEIVDTLKEMTAGERTLTLSLAGNEVIADTLFGYLWRILLILPPAAAVVVLGVFYFMLRNRKLTVLSMLPAGFAALWTLGTIFGRGEAVNLVTAVSPIFVVVMGAADGLHYVTHFMDGMSEHRDRRELTARTLRMVGKPIVLTTMTTMAGFGSLAWADVGPIREMGIFVPLGIGYAGFLSLVFLPAVLTRISLPAVVHRAHTGGFTDLLARVPQHTWCVIVPIAVLVTLSAVSVSGLKVVSDQLMFFKEGSSIRQTFDKVEENFGGALTIIGEIPALRGLETLRDYDYAEEVLDVERELERMPGVVNAHSLFDTVLSRYTTGTRRSEYPESPNTVHHILMRMDEEDLESWHADDGLRLVVRTEDLSREDVARLRQFESERAEIRNLNGTPILYDELSRLTVEGQVKSLGLAFVLVFVMLIVSLRRVRAALVALIPIAVTVLAIMGVLAVSGFHLNLVTATLSAVAVGVGVDYAIHLISGIEYYRKQGLVGPEAVEAALSTVSRPILANAFGLAIGLSVLFLSPLHIHTQVATVMWVAMMVSSLVALSVIPLFYQADSGEQETSPGSAAPETSQ